MHLNIQFDDGGRPKQVETDDGVQFISAKRAE